MKNTFTEDLFKIMQQHNVSKFYPADIDAIVTQGYCKNFCIEFEKPNNEVAMIVESFEEE